MAAPRRLHLALAVCAAGVVVLLVLLRLAAPEPGTRPARDARGPGAAPDANAPDALERPAHDAHARDPAAERAQAPRAPDADRAARAQPDGRAGDGAEGVRVRGRVLDALTGAPIERFRVDDRAFEDPEGRFECVAPRGAGLRVAARGRREWSCTEGALLDLVARGPCEVRLALDPEAGGLRVRVRDPEGAPLAGVRVRSFGGLEPLDERTDAAGALHVEELAAGAFELRLDLDGWTDARVDVRVARGTTFERDVVLQRARPVSLRVHDALGRVARRAAIAVASADGRGVPFHWRGAPDEGGTRAADAAPLATDEGALFELPVADGRIEGLPPGRYVLRLVHPGEAERALPFEVRADAVAALEVRYDEPAPADRPR